MTNSATFDTNLLIYSVDSIDPEKHRIAKRVIGACYRTGSPVALQCLSEFYRASTRKKVLAPAAASQIVEQMRTAMIVVPPASEDLMEAMRTHQQHGFSFFDALLWATARRAGCNLFLTEDLQDGRTLGGLTFCNPFKLSAPELDQLLA